MSKNKKNNLIGKEKEFRNFVLNSSFESLFLLNKENLNIKDLTDKEKENQNITYIGINLWLKKMEIIFWNNKDNLIENNIQYTRSDFNSNLLPYELIKNAFKANITSNTSIRLIIKLPSLKNDQNKEKAAILPILKNIESILKEVNTNSEIKIINDNNWNTNHDAIDSNFDNKNNSANLIIDKADLIWNNVWNPFFLSQKITRRTFRNILEPSEAEILNLLSNTHKDKVYDKEDVLDNITYIGIDLGLKKTGFAFLDYSSNEINHDNIDYFKDIKSENIGYNLRDLKPDSKPYEKIKYFFNKYIKKDSIVRIIIEIPFFKKNEKTKANQRDFIIETFEILLNEIKNKYEIKLIFAHDWRVYYIEYDSIFDDHNTNNIFSLDKTNKIKKISHDLTDINNDDEAEATLIVNKAHKIWNNTKL